MYTCRHIKLKNKTTYYPNPKPNNKKYIKSGPQTPNFNPAFIIWPKSERIAALRLRLGFIGQATP